MQTSETFLHKHYPHLREDFTTSNSTRVDFPSYLSLSLSLLKSCYARRGPNR